jgi:hypothetical protein
MFSKWFASALYCIFLLQACSRNLPVAPTTPPGNPVTPSKPVDTTKGTTPPPSYIYIPGNWSCQVDGINYSGTIDTSFTQLNINGSFVDTILDCTGTTTDKRANIHFKLSFNRSGTRNVPYFSTVASQAMFAFDTCSNNILDASDNLSNIQFTIDSVTFTALAAHFSGTASCYTQSGAYSNHIITNGQFFAGFHGGDHDANSFSYVSNMDTVDGYFNEARMISNSLVLDGSPFYWGGQQKFRLIIRTGGTIRPGIYKSADGNVGLQWFIPSIYRNYVNDSLGSLTVTISSVNGNTVTGSFSGTSGGGYPITTGSFAVRIKNYLPETDAADRWAFGEDESIWLYRTFAGNTTNSTLGQMGSRYVLTVNGQSDHGASAFKLVLSSDNPIKKGIYQSEDPFNPSTDRLDSLYFISPEKIWNGNNTYLFEGNNYPTSVRIDSIDDHHVEGQLQGILDIYLSEAGITSAYIREGRFSASF